MCVTQKTPRTLRRDPQNHSNELPTIHTHALICTKKMPHANCRLTLIPDPPSLRQSEIEWQNRKEGATYKYVFIPKSVLTTDLWKLNSE